MQANVNTDITRKMNALNLAQRYLIERMIELTKIPDEFLIDPANIANTIDLNYVTLPERFLALHKLWRRSGTQYIPFEKEGIISYDHLLDRVGQNFFDSSINAAPLLAAIKEPNCYFDQHFNNTFTDDETITGATSGATATVDSVSGTTLTYSSLTGTFQAGETIQGATSGTQATVSTDSDPTMTIAITGGTKEIKMSYQRLAADIEAYDKLLVTTIQCGFSLFATSVTGAVRFNIDDQYYSSGWLASDDTYAQMNSTADINSNIDTLENGTPVYTVPIKARTQDTNTQMKISALSVKQATETKAADLSLATFDSDKTEYTGGVIQQQDKLPTDATAWATMTTDENLSYGGGVLTGNLTGGEVSGGWMDLSGGVIEKYCDWTATSNYDFQQEGTIKKIIKPSYSGNPATIQNIIVISKASGDSDNLINLYQKTDGNLRLIINDSSGVTKLAVDLGVWNPTSGTEYEFELNVDLDETVGANTYVRLFIDGTQFGSTQTSFTCSRDSSIALYRCGTNLGIGDKANFSVKDIICFSTVQHTANYTAGYTLPEARYLEDLITFASLVFDTPVASDVFTNGETISGATSNASAVIKSSGNDYLFLNVLDKDGSWSTGETITGSDSGATAVANTFTEKVQDLEWNLKYKLLLCEAAALIWLHMKDNNEVEMKSNIVDNLINMFSVVNRNNETEQWSVY